MLVQRFEPQGRLFTNFHYIIIIVVIVVLVVVVESDVKPSARLHEKKKSLTNLSAKEETCLT